ncbi:MAG: type II toxin-antitoxin system VapC family toxin [Candidatus Methanoperedens sp.]|nr:type II toxin-antitoxin system VapC family toxin [Candidatus Methanoperedens sp.]
MKIFIDTSIVVDIERGNEETDNLLQHLILTNNTILVSTVVTSEVFTGTYLRQDYKKATKKAKELFSCFHIIPLDMEIAEITGKISAYLIANGIPVEYQDVAIAATFVRERGDWLLTKNKKHFTIIPGLEKVAISPAEFKKT